MFRVKRRKSRQVKIGNVCIGGKAPVSVQSMTTTPSQDVKATVRQIRELEEAGCEIVRVAVPDAGAASALTAIKKAISIPLVADIHFDHRLALAAIDAGVDKIRINPGNIGAKEKVAKVVLRAKEKKTPIRIGVNAGSLDKKYSRLRLADSLVKSALEHVSFFESLGFFDMVLSVKSSSVLTSIEAYRQLAKECDYPLHLGITEAGTVLTGAIKSSVGLGVLLNEGIGDTLRVSLTSDPVKEVLVGFEILQSLGLRQERPELISCPTCARCEIDLIPLAEEVERRLMKLNKPVKVAVMGCVVNGPGEAREADVGLAAGKGSAVLFVRGEVICKVKESEMVEALMDEITKLES